MVKGREQVDSIVGELIGLRNKPQRRGDTKLSCYATLVLFSGERKVGMFRIGADYVVERPLEKGQSSYSVAIGEADIQKLSMLLREIAPAKCD